ncbi:MAG: Crp/Fnr family transcriptional regulator [Chloroflexota bacterium]|nr:Crp/Fnr family transcriptional regulator [Chloroflexota bacterium]
MAGNVIKRVLGTVRGDQSGVQVNLPYKRDYLRKIDLFRDLSHDEMEMLDQTTRMTTVEKGRVVYRQDDKAQGLFLLKTGRVRLSRITAGGKKLDLTILEPGTFFGEMPLLGERMRNTFAEAAEDCLLCVMSQYDIEQLVLRNPRVGLRMIAVLSRRLAESEARLEDLAYRSVPARLASVLLRLGTDGVVEGITHEELGDMVGAYRETVTKTLNEFQSAGYVKLGRRRVAILEPTGLAALLEDS